MRDYSKSLRDRTSTAPPEGRDFQWRDCRKAVDTYLRGIKFSERNQ